MGLRMIRELGDPVLGKKAKAVKEMTPKLKQLIADMKETMYDSDGVGLAAPQVGMLKRIVVCARKERSGHKTPPCGRQGP